MKVAARRPSRPADRVGASRAPYAVVGVAAVLILVTAVWGGWLNDRGKGIGLHAAPLFAAASNRFGPLVVVPIALCVLLVWWGPHLAARVPWRTVVALVFAGAAVWGVALAVVDHSATDGLLRGVRGSTDFLAEVGRVAAPGPFLDTFTDRIGSYVVHVRGHPPALVLVLWWMERVGLGGPVPFAALAIAGGAGAATAAIVACREIAGEQAARRAAPFLVASPAAIWLVASADAIYAGVGAIGVAMVVVASARTGPRSDMLSIVGGLALGIGLFMSYGLVLLLVIPAAVAVDRRRVRPIAVACAAMVVVGVVFAAFGFSWIDGVRATRVEYVLSIAAIRPYAYFVFANLAAFAIVLGPAPVAGLALLRDRRLWLVCGAALVAVLLADVSGLSKGEVERIWLPFWPWIALAAASITSRVRWWLAAQGVVAIGVQAFLGTPW